MAKKEIVIVIDTETGSTDISKAGICQVAAVVITRDGKFNTLMSTYCKPHPNKKMEDGAIEIHGITPDKYQWSPTQKWALAALDLYINKMAETYDVYLCGHNGDRYDLPLIQLSYPQGKFNTYPTIDTLQWARRLYTDTRHKLGILYTYLTGKTELNAHYAAADFYMTGEFLIHMLYQLKM